MDRVVVVFLGLTLAAGVIYAAWWHFRKQQLQRDAEAEAELRVAVQERCKAGGWKSLKYAELVAELGIQPHVAVAYARKTYTNTYRKALTDGGDVSEESGWEKLREALELPKAVAQKIREDEKDRLISDAAKSVLQGGRVSVEDALELRGLRKRLGVTAADVATLVGDDIRKAYVKQFEAIADDLVITPVEYSELEMLRKTFGIDKHQANAWVQSHAKNLFRGLVANALEDGQVMPDEESALHWIAKEFDLSNSFCRPHFDNLLRCKQLAEYRNGKLPSVRTKLILDSGVLCHYVGKCGIRWKTARGSSTTMGELVVTSAGLQFLSTTRSFNVPAGRLVSVELHRRAIYVQATSGKATGEYFVDDPEFAEAILVGMIRRAKRQTTGETQMSRHIPPHVKAEVWHRDGGRCVDCQADDYLEFDHIIPHAKGGANTVGNIQLLCRRCNGSKSDRI